MVSIWISNNSATNTLLQSVTCRAKDFGFLRHLKSGAKQLQATEFTRTKQNKSFFSVDIETGEHRSSRRFRRHFFDGILTFGFLEECPRGSFPGTRRLRGKCWSKPQHSQGLEVNSFFGLKIQSLIGANSDFFRHNNSVARTKEIHYEIERNPFHRSNRLSWIHLSRRRPSLQVRLPVKCSGEGHVVEGSLKNIRIRKYICVSSDFQPGQRPCQSRAASSGYSTPPGLEAAPWKVKDKQPVSSSAWLECVPPVQSSIHSHGILCG